VSDSEFRSVVARLGETRPAPTARAAMASLAVLGAGPVGLAIACEALAEGVDARIWSPVGTDTPSTVTVRGAHLVGTYRIGTDPAPAVVRALGVDDAVRDVDVICVATPSLEHSSVAGLLAPHVTANQTIVLVPGRGFGAAEMRRALLRCGVDALPSIGVLAAPPYLATSGAPGQVTIHARLRHVVGSPEVEPLTQLFPEIAIAPSATAASFHDLLGVLNVPPLVLNVAAATGSRRADAMTPAVSDVCEALDRERREVAFAYGVRDLPGAADALAAAHDVAAGSLHEVWHTIEAFDDLVLPATPLKRLLADDVACSLVPVSSAGACAGIATPATDAMVATASLLVGVDLRALGRTFGALGLDAMSPDAVRKAVG
jgi:opine dehydrogenase